VVLRAHLGYTATEVRAQVIRKLHHRCWVAGTPAAASHHPSETGANDVVIEHLLQASWQIAAGELEPHSMPVEDIWQVRDPCWTLRCDGCRRQLAADGGTRHWSSQAAARQAADDHGWDGALELCPACLALVIPLRRRRFGSLVGAPAVG
jgi:hypothetical protein